MSIVQKGIVACVILAGLYSCEKHDVYEGDGQDKVELKDLVVPADFDWKTSDDIKCVLTATTPARVEIYTDATCRIGSRIADMYVDAETEPVSLVLARGVKEVYMRYMDREGKYNVQSVAVDNGKVSLVLPEGSRNFSAVPVKTQGTDYSKLKAEGTVLFEDNYPQKGDYDFNDYVMTYELEAKFDKNKKLEKIEVEIEFVAKGGGLPYEPYLCLRGIKYQLGKDIITIDEEDTEKGVGVEAFKHDGNDNDLILKFTGVAEAMERMKMQESRYINTSKGHTTADFVKLEFDIDFVGNALNKYQGGDIYDFFLGGEINGWFTEIHAKEFSSTRLMTQGKVEAGKYCTADNFVWVMKINEDLYDDSKTVGDYDVFPYLNEKHDFLKGYPDFKGYVEAGGKGAYGWCQKRNRVDKYLIFFED